MRFGPRRDTYGYIVFAATSMIYFASGMAVTQNVLRQSATMPLLIAGGLLAVALVNGALWGAFYLLRRFAARQKQSVAENPNP